MPYKNIDPNLWGSSLWTFLHYLSLSYPEDPTTDEQELVYNYLSSMQKIIPCEKCRKNFNKHLDSMEVEVLLTRDNLVRWLFNVHNLVNADTGKSQFSYDDFIKKYSITYKEQQENKVTNKEYFDIIAKNRNLENIVLTLNQEIKALQNVKSTTEHFSFSSNTVIIGLILLVIIVIILILILINRKK
jgi:hypothetical protein